MIRVGDLVEWTPTCFPHDRQRGHVRAVGPDGVVVAYGPWDDEMFVPAARLHELTLCN